MTTHFWFYCAENSPPTTSSSSSQSQTQPLVAEELDERLKEMQKEYQLNAETVRRMRHEIVPWVATYAARRIPSNATHVPFKQLLVCLNEEVFGGEKVFWVCFNLCVRPQAGYSFLSVHASS